MRSLGFYNGLFSKCYVLNRILNAVYVERANMSSQKTTLSFDIFDCVWCDAIDLVGFDKSVSYVRTVMHFQLWAKCVINNNCALLYSVTLKHIVLIFEEFLMCKHLQGYINKEG